MPGITVADAPPDRDTIDDVLAAVCFTDAYSRHTVIDEEDTAVAYTGYDRYPIDVFETDDCTIVLEGISTEPTTSSPQ